MKKLMFFAFFSLVLMTANQSFGQAHKDNIQIYFSDTELVFYEFGEYVKVEFLLEGMYNSSKPYMEKIQQIDEIKKLSIKNMPNQHGQNSAYALLNKENYQVAFTKLANTIFKVQTVKVGESKKIIDVATFISNNPVKK